MMQWLCLTYNVMHVAEFCGAEKHSTEEVNDFTFKFFMDLCKIYVRYNDYF